MALKVSPDALVSVDRARAYLQNQGIPAEGQDMLVLHVNAASGFVLGFCGRRRLAYVAADLTEYRRGNGGQTMWTREAPIKQVVSVTLYPHLASPAPIVIAGPAAGQLANADMYYDEREGFIHLTSYVFPLEEAAVRLIYRAGYYADGSPQAGDAAEPERALLELVCCELILRKWKRYQAKSIGVVSESSGDHSVTYDTSDLDAGTRKTLEHFRRNQVI